MKFSARALNVAAFAALTLCISAAEPRAVSGIYPHLAMFNNESECGTGAVVPWADRLWVITYAPHMPKGSSDKLYEITPALEQIIRPESIGGTPANRMIHRESGQLFIGPYAIDAQRNVRAIPYSTMFGRHTGLARHLTDPAGKIVFATMEEGIYEVDVKTLVPATLWADEQVKEGRHANLQGYHGKGFYSAQGRYIYANNGDHAKEALSNPAVPSGVLAEWDGKADTWTVVRRNQFTDVTGPGGIGGSAPDSPVWSIGWDHRSLILMLLDRGKWSAFRLPSVITVNMARTGDDGHLFHKPGTLVEFAARGIDVDVAWCGGLTKKVTGSSFAAPHVAGMLACLLSEKPGLTSLQAKTLFQRIARPWTPEYAAANVR